MKEDYLWDKMGDDPEIKRLEKALAVFRYYETGPPADPAAKAPTFAEETQGRKFSLSFSFAACAAAIVILFTVWFQFPGGKIEADKDLAKKAPARIDRDSRNDSIVRKVDVQPVEKVEDREPTRDAVKTHRPVPVVNRKNKTDIKHLAVKKQTVTLTSEEKFAYGQLMLALSITSSKLNIVKDKIDGN